MSMKKVFEKLKDSDNLSMTFIKKGDMLSMMIVINDNPPLIIKGNADTIDDQFDKVFVEAYDYQEEIADTLEAYKAELKKKVEDTKKTSTPAKSSKTKAKAKEDDTKATCEDDSCEEETKEDKSIDSDLDDLFD